MAPDRYLEVRSLVTEITDRSYRAYGYRRVQSVLATQHGISLSGKTVLKLMKQQGRQCKVRRKKYRSYKGDIGVAAPNILECNFKAQSPNQKWATDVTEFRVLGQKQYFSPVLDLFNGEVLSYDIRSSPALPLIATMLDGAIAALRPGPSPILHSDQGWQYRHWQYQKTLKQNGIKQSMSRKGNCLDNAVAENFFGHFKEEFLRPGQFQSLTHFKAELAQYIHWFNHERIQLKLKGLSPVDYRTQSLATVAPDSYLTVQ